MKKKNRNGISNNKIIFKNKTFIIKLDNNFMEMVDYLKTIDGSILEDRLEYINKEAEKYKKADDVIEAIRRIFDFDGYIFMSDYYKMYQTLIENKKINNILENNYLLEDLGEEDSDEYIENIVYIYWQTIGDEEFEIFENSITIEYL